MQAGEVQHTTGKGKLLTGYVAQDMTPGAAKAIDPYAFKKNGGWFIRKAAAEKARAEWPNETRDEPQLAMSDPQLPAPAPGSVAAAATDAAPAPTDAQKQAGNYAKGHSRWQGLALSIENQKGSERSGTGRDGNPWSVTMPAHYGYFKGTEGADGDHVDFYMGDDEASDFVLVVDQKDADTGAFDEHKVILGTRDAAEALTTYKAGFSDGRGADRIGGVREFSRDEFKDWLANGDTRKPASPQFEGQNRPASNPDQITKPQQTLVKAALEPAVDPIPIKKPEAAPASGPQKSGPGFLKVLNAAKGAKAKHRLRAEATADYLAPGNVVPSYGGGHDIVLAYDAEARSIRVQPAIRQGDGWVSDPSQPARTHATLPEDRALATGPVYRDAAKIEAPAAAPETGITRRPVKADKAITARGRELAVEYSVVELDDLMPSQMDDGRDNPDFPQELQPRDRSGNKSQEQVRKIAQDLRPGLLGENPQASAGAPIVTKDGTVISGNGRTLALRRAHAEGAAGRYREWLAHKGYPVDGMRQPVLVRVLTDDMDTDALAATAREANERDTQAMSASEQAEADARTMSPSVLDLYRGGEVDSAGNRDFVRAFLGQVVAPSDMGNLIRDDGSMTQDAVRRVQAAMLSRAYGDSDLVGAIMEATESSIKAIGGALTDVAARWAQMRDAAKDGVIAPQMDQTAALLEAVRIVDRARRAGRKVDEFVGQGDMFSGESVSPMGRAFLDMMFRDAPNSYARATGRDSLAETLGRYAAEAMKSQPGADMLGETADPQATAQAVKGSRDGRQDEQQNSLFSAGDAGRGEGAGRPEPKGTGPDVPGQQAAVGSVDPQAGEGRQPEGLNSDTFVRAPDGSNDFGEITADIARAIGRQGGAIRLRAGDDATGLRHIEQRHGEQIRDLGYPSIEAFIAEIARNFGAVYPRAGRALDLVLDADARGLLIVQLEPDASGDFYDVRTATPIRRGQYARKEPLWERAGPSVSPESASSPLDPKGQSGTDNVGANATPDKPAAGLLSTLSAEKQARAAELKAKLAAKARTQVSSGLDPEYITLGGELVALYLEAGTRKFGQMLRDFAETTGLTLREAQAPMRAAYNHVRDDMDLAGQDVSDMDDAAAVMAEVRKAMAEEAAAGTPKQADPEPSAPAPKKVVRPKGDAAGDKAHQPMTGLDALDFDAWDDKTREDGQGSPAKRKGRDITGTWAKTVAKILKDAGWTPALDRKGKALAPVTFGYGMAHEIDETKLSLTTPNGLELFVKIGSPHDMRTKASILVQFTGEPPKKGYSRPFVGPNEWLRDTITPAEAAAQIAEWAERRSNWLRKKAESPVTGAPSGATVIEQGDVPAGGNADADADSVRLVQAGSAEDPGRGNGRGDAPRAGAQGSDRPLAGAPSEDVGDAGTGARAGSRGDRALAPRAQVDDGEPAGGMGPTEAREIADAEWLLMEPESEDQQNPLPLPLREQDALTTF